MTPRIKTITAASALALLISVQAHAAGMDNNAAGGEAMATAGTAAKDGPGDADSDSRSAVTKAGDAVAKAADDVKALFLGKDSKKLEPVLIRRSMTAEGLLGQPLRNPEGERIATIKDVIVDKGGTAKLVVVSDSGPLGIGGKVAAFDYDRVVTQDADGQTVVSLSQDMIDHAKDFSYDQKDWAKAKVIPAGSISVKNLLKGDVLDNTGKKVASVENVYLRNGEVSQVIVGFDKILGMGGELAALDFNDLQIVKKKDEVNFKLNAQQSSTFRNFKKAASN